MLSEDARYVRFRNNLYPLALVVVIYLLLLLLLRSNVMVCELCENIKELKVSWF